MQHNDEGFLLYAKGNNSVDLGWFYGGAISPELLIKLGQPLVSYSFIN